MPTAKLGIGRVQGSGRYQAFTPASNGPGRTRWEASLHYFLGDTPSRVTLAFNRDNFADGTRGTSLRLALQLLL